jgi:type I restriction enzyme S subunit
LRKGLAEEVAICSVTSLPSITFASAGTTTKTSILHLKKTEKQTRHSSAFAICNDVGFNVVTKGSIRQKISTGTSDLPQIFRNLTSSRPKNESMTIRWIRNAEQEDRWDASFHASLPDFIQHQLDSPPLDSVRISDVAELAADKVDPRSLDQATFDYIEISDVDGSALLAKSKAVATQEAPGRARRLVAPGDVLVSTVRPERKSVAVIRDDQVGAVATTGFAVLRPAGIHPYVLGTLLRSDFVTAQLIRSNVGIAYPAIDERCLLDVLLPIKKSDLHRGDNKADEVFKAELNLQEKRAEFEAVVAPVFPADS